MIGVVLLVGVLSDDVAFTDRYLRGVMFGLATGLAYANYLVTIKYATRNEGIPDVVVFMAWTSLSSAFFLGLTGCFESGPMLPPDWQSWALLISLGVVAQACGWWAITTGLKSVIAPRAGLILLLQPTLATVWGVLYFSEQLAAEQLIGAVITLAAIYFGGLRNGT
jgi:drug/metabolite transporter (DMT)-like permease